MGNENIGGEVTGVRESSGAGPEVAEGYLRSHIQCKATLFSSLALQQLPHCSM